MHLSKIAEITSGKLIGTDLNIEHFYIDGRQQVAVGSCYLAIKGEQHDGHDFIEQASQNGASAAIISKQYVDCTLPYVQVKDVQLALGQLAAFHRQQFKLPVAAVTGSCGKTTVKEMLKAILPKTALLTAGNLNNHLGAPLTLLKLNAEHSHAVLELGANHIGEIAQTAAWVQPQISLINNIAPAHLEGFGSIEGVAKAKGEIYQALPADGLAIVNLDDERVVEQAQLYCQNQFSYALNNPKADLYASEITESEQGIAKFNLHTRASNQALPIQLQVPGLHNVKNALAACSVALALGVSLAQIQQGLAAFTGVAGRLNIKISTSGLKLIDDTYNANLHSVKAAIDVLASHAGKKVFVLGELAEVGADLPSHYQQIGDYARQQKIDVFFTCGNQVELARKHFDGAGGHYANKQQLLAALMPLSTLDGAAVLVKGSRSAAMEQVVNDLMNNDHSN